MGEKYSYYMAKLHETLALVYIDQYYYKTANGHMQKAEEIILANSELKEKRYLKFKLKQANFYKKAGFYLRANQQFEELQAEEITDQRLEFRVLRDHARVQAVLNRSDKSIASFQKAEETLDSMLP